MNSNETKSLSEPNSKVELKLLIDKKDRRVLFAEANSDFVDFLFSLMSLPLGMISKLLENGEMVGSISDLYNSIKTLNQSYLKSSNSLEPIFNAKPPTTLAFKNPLLLTNTESVKRKLYTCLCRQQRIYHSNGYVTDDPRTLCPSCNMSMVSEVQFVTRKDEGGCSNGFVEGLVTYVVMDNLEVKPFSAMSGISLLKSFNIQDLKTLEEMDVEVGPAEGLKLLEESLQSKNVLTNVFLTRRSKRKI